jgi:hypothetical protein
LAPQTLLDAAEVVAAVIRTFRQQDVQYQVPEGVTRWGLNEAAFAAVEELSR